MKRLRQQPQAQRPVGTRRRQRGTPPNVIGKGPLLSAPGLQLGVVVIIRNEAPHLEEWLAYHRALGVQHFFIYDNGSDDELHEVIEAWVNHGLVTLVHWPLPGGQIDAYSHALRFYGPSVAWLAFFDVDEFVVPLVDDDIPSLLARWPDAADIRMPRVDFGFSGHRTPPDGLTIEAYIEVANVFGRDPAKPLRVKTVLQPRAVSAMGIHTATVADAPLTADGRPLPRETIGVGCHELVQVNHYYTRSFEEFEAKRFRGSATGRIARPAIPFELPALRIDRSAMRFAAQTRATMALLRSLEPSPYHYGSQLALSQFPHFNDLGLFAEFAIANTVMEEPEPRREPRLRLENLLLGTGFVADISATDHSPRRGDLSLSMHLAPLLERSRGRLEASWAAAPAEVASTLRAGTATEAEDGWRLSAAEGVVEVAFGIDARGHRRCHALGFVLRAPGPTRLELELGRQDGSSAPVEAQLVTAGTYAGVVEFEALPALATAGTLRVEAARGDVVMHDLFVMSYG
jgi:hypothetical protein